MAKNSSNATSLAAKKEKLGMMKKRRELMLEETKPGTRIKEHPDYKAIMSAIKREGCKVE